MFRSEIYVTENKKYLLTDFHHIIADGNSYDIIFADINKSYIGKKLESETYTGFDAALDEEQQIKDGKYKKAEKYFDSIFEGLETESLPLPDNSSKKPKKGYTEKHIRISENKILAYCENLVLHLIPYLQAYLVYLWRNTQILMIVFSLRFITAEMIQGLKIQFVCLLRHFQFIVHSRIKQLYNHI